MSEDHTPITDILRNMAEHGIFTSADNTAKASPTLFTAAADEIERLRAENDNLRAALAVKDNHDRLDCTAERAVLRLENQRLQALIDAYVAVDQNPDDTGWDDAYNALLAAATKEDDRG